MKPTSDCTIQELWDWLDKRMAETNDIDFPRREYHATLRVIEEFNACRIAASIPKTVTESLNDVLSVAVGLLNEPSPPTRSDHKLLKLIDHINTRIGQS